LKKRSIAELRCSTPCGITEFGTEEVALAVDQPQAVLNALRHH